jgi:hypothetical protein
MYFVGSCRSKPERNTVDVDYRCRLGPIDRISDHSLVIPHKLAYERAQKAAFPSETPKQVVVYASKTTTLSSQTSTSQATCAITS